MSAVRPTRRTGRSLLAASRGSSSGSAGDWHGKAGGLARLKAAGCRVPRFIVVPASCFSDALSEVADFRHALDAAAAADEASCAGQAAAIAAVLDRDPVATRLRAVVAASLAGRLTDRRRYAVRSSAVGEDSAAASYAGQLETRLNVPAPQAVDAVIAVWRSAFSARVLAYRAHRRLATRELAAAVIVQEMLEPEAAGVLFTRGPECPNELVVCAGYGLGEGIVADRVAVDTYRIDRRTGSVASQIACKATRVASSSDGGTQVEPVDIAARLQPALSDRVLRQLWMLGLGLEARFGVALDIEFAVDRRGRIHALQARPITATLAPAAAVRVWDNANVVESYPGLTLPLTFSFAQAGYAAAFAAYMRRRAIDYFPFRSPLRDRPALFQTLIGLIDGRVYYNLLSWYEMMSVLPGFARIRVSWDRMIGTAGAPPAREHRLAAPARVLAWGYCAWKLLRTGGTVRAFHRVFARVHARFATRKFDDLTADALIDEYEALKAALADDWSLTLDNDFAAMAYFELVHALCRRWAGADGIALANALLRGAAGMESVQPVLALGALAARIRREPELAALFGEPDDERVLAGLRASAAHHDVATALGDYLERYGDRCPEELKLERETFRERPALVIATLRTLLASRRDPGAPERTPAEDKALLAAIAGRVRRAVLAWAVRRARFAIASRENMRFARARVFGIARRIFGALGRRFAEHGVLDRPEDLHYLTVDEVCAYARGTSVSRGLRSLVALRRGEYQEFARRDAPSRMATHGIPYGRDPRAATDGAAGATVRGVGCSGGEARAAARIVRDPHAAPPAGRHILVAASTDPGWVFLMTRAEGLVVERGSVLSHTAIIGREFGIPTVVGVTGATRRIPEGAELSIDGTTGRVEWQSSN